MNKKSKNKKLAMIISIVVIVAVVFTLAVIFNTKPKENIIKEEFAITYEDGVKINTSEELAKDKQLDSYTITNIKLSNRNNISTLLADVTNNGNQTEEQIVRIEMLDKNGNIIMELKGTLKALAQGETTQLNVNVSADIVGAYDFRISKW